MNNDGADDRLQNLERQVRNLRAAVIVLAIVVVVNIVGLQRVLGGFTIATAAVGALIGVLVVVFGGARLFDKSSSPK